MVTMVVIRCPETDREVPTGIMTDLARFDGSEGYATLLCPHCRDNATVGPCVMPSCRLHSDRGRKRGRRRTSFRP